MTDDKKQELIERYRDINVDHEWWDSTYDDFHGICKRMGIDLDKGEPSFSGFWSQGDGASFTGSFSGSIADTAAETIRNYAPLDTELHRIADELTLLGRIYYRAYARIGRPYGNHHCHQYTMYVADFEPLESEVDDWADDIHEAVEQGLQELFRDLASWLYSMLEQEYDHLTSDEIMWESIVANELHLEEEDA